MVRECRLYGEEKEGEKTIEGKERERETVSSVTDYNFNLEKNKTRYYSVAQCLRPSH